MPDHRNNAIPSIAELRKVCQARKLADRRWWYTVYRRLSIYITWAALHTSVSANQVSAMSLAALVVALVLIALPQAPLSLAGYAMVLVYFFLDKVDGEVARYRRVFSVRGVYMDELGHCWCFAGVFLATTIRIAPASPWPVLVWSLGAATAVVMLLNRMSKSAPYQLFGQYVVEKPELLAHEPEASSVLDRASLHAERFGEQEQTPGGRPRGALALTLARDQVLIWSQFLIAYWLFVAASIVELATGSRAVFVWILIVEGVFQPLVYAALVVVNLRSNVVRECRRLDAQAPRRSGAAESGAGNAVGR